MTTTTCLVVDLETLGMAPPAAVIELGWTSAQISEDDVTLGDLEDSMLFGIPEGQTMSSDNRAVHHIDPASLQGLEVFDPQHFASRGMDDVEYCVAHNSEFEQAFLSCWERPWICTYKVALRLLPDAPSHGNQALKYELGIEDRAEHHPPHRALPDAIVTSLVLVQLVRRALESGEHGSSVAEVLSTFAQWTTEPRLLPRCPIGKFRGRPWSEVESGFLSWMLRQPDMEADLRWNAERELTRRRRGD